MDSAILASIVGTATLVGGGALAWASRVVGTQKDTTANRDSIDKLDKEHGDRLKGHDEDILDIREKFVTRREFDDKLASSMGTILVNYANIKEQLTVHGRWLEFAVFNKKPDQPTISSKL